MLHIKNQYTPIHIQSQSKNQYIPTPVKFQITIIRLKWTCKLMKNHSLIQPQEKNITVQQKIILKEMFLTGFIRCLFKLNVHKRPINIIKIWNSHYLKIVSMFSMDRKTYWESKCTKTRALDNCFRLLLILYPLNRNL